MCKFKKFDYIEEMEEYAEELKENKGYKELYIYKTYYGEYILRDSDYKIEEDEILFKII